MRNTLLNLLVRKSFKYSLNPPFTLSSGKISPYYIDCKHTTYNPEGMYLIGEIVFSLVHCYKPDAIGGLTLGADPIAIATALISQMKGEPINAFTVRKEPKEHGTQKWIEGDIQSGNRVIVVEDVITTGASAIRCIERLRAEDIEPIIVIALIDRQEESGKENIESLGIKVSSLFTLDDFIRSMPAPKP